MAEYIERQEAFEDFEKCNRENPKWTPSRVKTLIARQKAADVAQVVRCKDCKHMEIDRGGRFCHVWGGYNGMGDDGFCNYGERKEGADDGKDQSDSGGV